MIGALLVLSHMLKLEALTFLAYQYLSMVCQDFVFGKEKEIGRREEWKGKEIMVCKVGIRMELRTNIKILSIGLVETSVPIEKTLICKKI
jgi:hypothetical protein